MRSVNLKNNQIQRGYYRNLGGGNRELKKRWSWLKKDKKIVLNRIIQDKEWIKKKITSNYGTKGFEKLKKFLKYKSNPFNTYNLIKKKI